MTAQSTWLVTISFMVLCGAALAISGNLAVPLLGISALLGGMVLIYLAAYYPFALAITFAASSMFRIHEALPILSPLRLPLILAAITAVSLLWHLVKGNLRPEWTSQIVWFVLFFGLVSFGVPLAASPSAAFSAWVDSFSKIFVMTLSVAWLVRNPHEFRSAARAIALFGLVVALVALRNKAIGVELVEDGRVTIGRSYGSILGDPNDLAFMLLPALGFAASLAFTARSRLERFIFAGTGLLVLLAITYTRSRGGLVGCFALGAVLAYATMRSRSVATVVIVVLVVTLYIGMGLSSRLTAGSVNGELDESAAGRIAMWSLATRVGLEHPVTGIGLANFEREAYRSSGKWKAVHNTWLSVMAESGIVGLGLFLGMVSATVYTLLAALRSLPLDNHIHRCMALGLLSSFAGLCGAGSFLSHGFSWPIYVLVGLTAALNSAIRRPVAEHPRRQTPVRQNPKTHQGVSTAVSYPPSKVR
jgi:putative inorganic carbon (HCO3(-)) transporter